MTKRNDRLNGKVVLVVGSTMGIGRAIALAAGREGARVVVAGRSEEQGAAVARQIVEEGSDGVFAKVDVTEPATV
jgi:NAD(P)-dependent dehydrogenase (short-subunit alcohol dehydrogenase family)